VRTQRDTPEESAPTAPRSLLRHAGLLLVSVPLSAVAAALVSIAVAKWTPWTDLGEMVLAMILMPILWGCAAYWAIADSKMLRPAVSIAASALLSAALLYL
ncbi:MAG TPA: hypothetical protein VKB34_06460, partial [Povalibacter sp.]|nr:hypothetical protein [Povalibacter sp.]